MKQKYGVVVMIAILIFTFTVGTVVAAEATELEKDLIEFIDLNSENTGLLSNTLFGAEWSVLNGAGDAPELIEENGNRFARIEGISQIISPYIMDNGEKYEFSAKIRLYNPEQTDLEFFPVAIFRAAPRVSRNNTYINASLYMEFYESDWYAQFFNRGESTMGGSGIGVMLRNDKIRVYLRTHIDGALRLGIAYHEFDYPDGMKQGDFIQLTVTDNGNDKVEIYVNGNMLTSISFSDQDYYSDDSEDSNDYYKTAAMSDPSGNNLDLYDSESKKIEAENNVIHNAMISAMESYTAFASREALLDIDDISISELTEKNTATEAPETNGGDKSTPDTSATETPGPATANTGDNINNSPSSNQNGNSSAASSASPASSASSDSSDGSSPVIPIVITVIGVAIVAAVVIYICIKRKK